MCTGRHRTRNWAYRVRAQAPKWQRPTGIRRGALFMSPWHVAHSRAGLRVCAMPVPVAPPVPVGMLLKMTIMFRHLGPWRGKGQPGSAALMPVEFGLLAYRGLAWPVPLSGPVEEATSS